MQVFELILTSRTISIIRFADAEHERFEQGAVFTGAKLRKDAPLALAKAPFFVSRGWTTDPGRLSWMGES